MTGNDYICSMEDIKKQYTIQWVGPFHSLEEAKTHREGAKNDLFATPDCFTFYYFRGNILDSKEFGLMVFSLTFSLLVILWLYAVI